MRSPPPMPMPPPPPSYQESLKKIQNSENPMAAEASHAPDTKYSQFHGNQRQGSPFLHLHHSNDAANRNFPQHNFPASNDSTCTAAVSTPSNYEMRQFLKTQNPINNIPVANSNKRDLSQYLNSQMCKTTCAPPPNVEFLRNNINTSNFIQQNVANSSKNYSAVKKPASNFTSDIEKELSDLTLTIEREMERQMEDSQKQQNEYFGVCAKCNKGYFLESSPSNYIFRLINVFFS